MEVDVEELLRSYQLKITPQRLSVLKYVTGCQYAVSQPELERKLGKKIDRVTLYRILTQMEEKGILHRVHDLHGLARFAICSSNCQAHMHHDNHIHFQCTICNNVYCINNFSMPKVKLPAGFIANTFKVSAEGTCKHCSQ
jgi:Fur family ferric uptake transcriptional regulator